MPSCVLRRSCLPGVFSSPRITYLCSDSERLALRLAAEKFLHLDHVFDAVVGFQMDFSGRETKWVLSEILAYQRLFGYEPIGSGYLICLTRFSVFGPGGIAWPAALRRSIDSLELD